MIKSIVVEDEINSRELLVNLLTSYCTDIEVIGSAEDVQSGIELIQQTQPDLVFLDIEMPDGDGFDLLDACPDRNFKVIFVTGYDHYAIKAIKYSALDYLVKPISFTELSTLIQKIKFQKGNSTQQLRLLHSALRAPVKSLEQIVLNFKSGQFVLSFDEIIYAQSIDRQVRFTLENQPPRLVAQTLSYYVDLFPEEQFVRIHKSYLVNLEKVTHYDAGRLGNIYLQNGQHLPIAARRKAEFIRRLRDYRGEEE